MTDMSIRFRDNIQRHTHCLFAQTVTVVGNTYTHDNNTDDNHIRNSVETLRQWRHGCPEGSTIHGCVIGTLQAFETIEELGMYFAQLVKGLANACGITKIEDLMASESSRHLCVFGEPCLVTVFWPGYPIEHPRYTFDETEATYVLFQPLRHFNNVTDKMRASVRVSFARNDREYTTQYSSAIQNAKLCPYAVLPDRALELSPPWWTALLRTE
eukprot:PhF_6_TR41202/c0_g1_i1/m.62343